MDIVLSGEMDGIDAAQKIREYYDIPVLYPTAYADDEFFRSTRVTKHYAYLLKTGTHREIQLTIEIALYHHKAERSARAMLEKAVIQHTGGSNHQYAADVFPGYGSYGHDWGKRSKYPPAKSGGL